MVFLQLNLTGKKENYQYIGHLESQNGIKDTQL